MSFFRDNWSYLKVEINWLERLLLGAAAKARKTESTFTRFAQNKADRATHSWWEGLVTLEKVGYDSPPPAATKPALNYQQSLDARIQQSREQGIPLALPMLCDRYGLSLFEKQALLLAIAPEVHRRYGELCAYLTGQSGVALPTVDLALRLFCRDDRAWREGRSLFVSGALPQQELLVAIAPAGQSFLDAPLKLAPDLVSYLLAEKPEPYLPSLHIQSDLLRSNLSLPNLSSPNLSLPNLSLPNLPPHHPTPLVSGISNVSKSLPNQELSNSEALSEPCKKPEWFAQIDRALAALLSAEAGNPRLPDIRSAIVWLGFDQYCKIAQASVNQTSVNQASVNQTSVNQAVEEAASELDWIADRLGCAVSSIDLSELTTQEQVQWIQTLRQSQPAQIPNALLLRGAQQWLSSRSALTTSQKQQALQALRAHYRSIILVLPYALALSQPWRSNILSTYSFSNTPARQRKSSVSRKSVSSRSPEFVTAASQIEVPDAAETLELSRDRGAVDSGAVSDSEPIANMNPATATHPPSTDDSPAQIAEDRSSDPATTATSAPDSIQNNRM